MSSRPFRTRKKSSVSSCLCQTNAPFTFTTMTSQSLNCVTVRGDQCSENEDSFSDRSIALDTGDLLFRRLLQRRRARQDHLDARAAARLGIEIKPAAEPRRHDAVDDVQAEPGAALVAPRREERIEGAAADVEAHAAAIVGKDDLDIVLAGL